VSQEYYKSATYTVTEQARSEKESEAMITLNNGFGVTGMLQGRTNWCEFGDKCENQREDTDEHDHHVEQVPLVTQVPDDVTRVLHVVTRLLR
jgi:hypothetical protein